MITFKEFLAEVKRSPERAMKLMNYVADRHGGDSNELRFKDWHYKGDRDPEYHDEAHMFDYRGVQKLAIKHITPGQGHFSFAGIKHYVQDGNDHNKPIVVIKHEGEHYIQDGHHRYVSRKLLGHEHINAHVYETNEHYRHDED